MLYSHLAHFEIIAYLMLFGKFPDAFAVLRGLDILVGHEMVRHQRYLILIEDALRLHLFHLFDGHRTCDVVAQHETELRLYQLPCLHTFKPCRSGKNLLCHRHSHNNLPPLFFFIAVIVAPFPQRSSQAFNIVLKLFFFPFKLSPEGIRLLKSQQ